MIEVRESKRFYAPLVIYVAVLVILLLAAAAISPLILSGGTGGATTGSTESGRRFTTDEDKTAFPVEARPFTNNPGASTRFDLPSG